MGKKLLAERFLDENGNIDWEKACDFYASQSSLKENIKDNIEVDEDEDESVPQDVIDSFNNIKNEYN